MIPTMCGRFTRASPKQAIVDGFQIREFWETPDDMVWDPRYSIAPTQNVASITQGRKLGWFRWGLIPKWAKDKSIVNRLINGRSETAAEKPSFRDAFKKRRCLVVADGFYEWQKTNAGKQPYFITMADELPFAFAGLWETWNDSGGDDIHTCTILTTEANEMMKPIHDRMPAILDGDDYDEWLAGDDVHHLLKPFLPELMASRPASRFVNSPKNDTPERIRGTHGN